MTLGSLKGGIKQTPSTTTELLVSPPTYIGYELEINNVRSSSVNADLHNNFRVEPDGSLRENGMEFTFNQPKQGEEIITALDDLYNKYWDDAWSLDHRGSVHVHLDVRPYEVPQLGWLSLMSAAAEDYLFSLCDSQYRSCSSFTRSIKANTSSMRQAMHNINGGNVSKNRVSEVYGDLERFENHITRGSERVASNMKYQATNLQAVRRFCSVEFRHFRPVGTMEEALLIINTIQKLSLSALDANPVDKFTEYFETVAPAAVSMMIKYDSIRENI